MLVGHHDILRVKLLRTRFEQGGLSQVGRTPTGHPLCAVHGGHWQDKATHFQAEDRTGGVVGYQGIARTYRQQQDEAGDRVP